MSDGEAGKSAGTPMPVRAPAASDGIGRALRKAFEDTRESGDPFAALLARLN